LPFAIRHFAASPHAAVRSIIPSIPSSVTDVWMVGCMYMFLAHPPLMVAMHTDLTSFRIRPSYSPSLLLSPSPFISPIRSCPVHLFWTFFGHFRTRLPNKKFHDQFWSSLFFLHFDFGSLWIWIWVIAPAFDLGSTRHSDPIRFSIFDFDVQHSTFNIWHPTLGNGTGSPTWFFPDISIIRQ
jgi:hypothetical protein